MATQGPRFPLVRQLPLRPEEKGDDQPKKDHRKQVFQEGQGGKFRDRSNCGKGNHDVIHNEEDDNPRNDSALDPGMAEPRDPADREKIDPCDDDGHRPLEPETQHGRSQASPECCASLEPACDCPHHYQGTDPVDQCCGGDVDRSSHEPADQNKPEIGGPIVFGRGWIHGVGLSRALFPSRPASSPLKILSRARERSKRSFGEAHNRHVPLPRKFLLAVRISEAVFRPSWFVPRLVCNIGSHPYSPVLREASRQPSEVILGAGGVPSQGEVERFVGICPGGGIGRHAGLRSLCLNSMRVRVSPRAP